jgi:hypothetical protein
MQVREGTVNTPRTSTSSSALGSATQGGLNTMFFTDSPFGLIPYFM